MYGRYRVLATKIKATFFIPSDTSNPLNVGIIMSPIQLGAYTQAEWQHLIRANPNNAKNVMAVPVIKTYTVSMYKKLGNLLGDPLAWRTNANYEAPYSANPAQIMYGYVYISACDNQVPAALTTPVTVKTEVTMYIKFFQKDLEVS